MKNFLSLLITLALCFVNLMTAHGQWTEKGSGITETNRTIWSISIVNEQVIWAIAFDATNVLSPANEFTRTLDGGATWISGHIADSAINYFPGKIFALNDTVAWVVMVSEPVEDRVKLFKTTNGGATWQEENGLFNEEGHAADGLYFFNENEGVLFGSPATSNISNDSLQIFRTADGGDTWNRIPPSELPTPLPNEAVYLYSGNGSSAAHGDELWFCTYANRVFRTSDKGLTWEAFNTGVTNPYGLASIAFKDSLNGIAVTFGPQEAARTTDGGETWSPITLPPTPDAAEIEYVPNTEGTYIFGDGFWNTSSTEYSVTTDNGDTWVTVTYPPSMNCMQFLSPTIGWGGTLITSATTGGMYQWVGNLDSLNVGVATIEDHDISIYPNPTNGFIYVSGISQKDFDQIVVTDFIGRIVKTIDAENFRTAIDLSAMPSGVYIVSVKREGMAVKVSHVILFRD